jgi:hypothetical protein
MRYKNNVLAKLDNVDATLLKIQVSANRNDQNLTLATIEELKTLLEDIRGTISIEPDDFEQQFAPKY